MTPPQAQPPDPGTILVVEDDEADFTFLSRSFKKERVSVPILRARDGLEALELLRGECGRPRILGPCVVLLDLNMPRMGGIEFLSRLRSDPELETTPVFVLTSSAEERDLSAAYAHHVAGYVQKTDDDERTRAFVRLVDLYRRVVMFP